MHFRSRIGYVRKELTADDGCKTGDTYGWNCTRLFAHPRKGMVNLVNIFSLSNSIAIFYGNFRHRDLRRSDISTANQRNTIPLFQKTNCGRKRRTFSAQEALKIYIAFLFSPVVRLNLDQIKKLLPFTSIPFKTPDAALRQSGYPRIVPSLS